ncbi:DUF6957 family protein [Pseudomonas fluorescens]|uniref:DUF6957 family protein n=1 Tax=Pseudomonas fluorescens TaxID=294 RepID=UPI00058A6802|nr:hypothetical protein [Pseudomonas fluorescens]CEL29242.1 hypothetical protein SRM1_02593 [Pseudomonas fluorescens]
MAGADGNELLNDDHTSIDGVSLSLDEARALVSDGFPKKAYCLVEQWTLFQANVSADDLAKIHAAGHLPLVVFAHRVIEDSRGRFQPGDWVRSSMCISFDGSILAETKNTVYVLVGPGRRLTAGLKTIFSFF